ncbi:MAG: tRNA (adenosine(37)-N6)-threonylcarbamoyltransferase complex dimerization subunit type 1 TsaB [Mariprofundaceae bacterium]
MILNNGQHHAAESEGDAPHSQAILPLLSRLLSKSGLEWPQLDRLALGIGPGSFTGLRVACATLSGLNVVLQRPVISLSSLSITARQATVAEPLWVIEDARSGDAYVGRYAGGDPLQPDCCMAWVDVLRMPAANYVSHTPPPIELPGWTRLDLRMARPEALATCVRQTAHVSALETCGHYVLPAYLRASQAEINMREDGR